MLTSVRQAAGSNPALFLAVIAWFIAQALKVVINLTVQNELNLKLLVSSGGMPSSHSALVCSCAATIGRLNGLHSTTFALAAVLWVLADIIWV